MTTGLPTVHRLAELDRAQRAWLTVVGVIAVVGSVALVVHLRTNALTQIGDEANQIYDSLRAFVDWPLLGDLNTSNFYGNVPSHHPGPLPYYLLAPFVIVLGPQLGAWVFAVTWNTTWLLLTGWFAYRTGGARFGGAALVIGIAATAGALQGRFTSVFFQDLPLTPLLFVMVAALALARGDTLALPVLAFAASYVVQAATLNLPLVAAVSIAGAAIAIHRARDDGTRPDRRVRRRLLAAAILVAAWAPPLWDQVAGSGNFGRLLRTDIPHAGLDGVAGLLEPLEEVLDEQLAFAVLALAIGALTSRRWPTLHRDGAALAIGSAALVGSIITAVLIPADDIETTHWNWVPMAGAAVVLAALACVTFDPRGHGARRRLLLPLGLLVIAFSTPLIGEPETWSRRERMREAVVELDEAIETLGPDRPPALSWRGPVIGLQVAQGLLPLLQDSESPVQRHFGGFSAEPGKDLLVVVNNEPTRRQTGRLVGVHRPIGNTRLTDVAERIAAHLRANRGLALRPTSVSNLASLLDGLVPAFCVPQIVADPDRLVEMGPDVLARLVALDFVSSPSLPTELERDARRWLDAQPVAVLVVEGEPSRLDDRLWSADSC